MLRMCDINQVSKMNLKRAAIWSGLVMLLPFVALFTFQQLRRLFFIAKHGGMDCATCNGSPMAFLIGWALETLVLVFLLLLFFPLVKAVRNQRANPAVKPTR